MGRASFGCSNLSDKSAHRETLSFLGMHASCAASYLSIFRSQGEFRTLVKLLQLLM